MAICVKRQALKLWNRLSNSSFPACMQNVLMVSAAAKTSLAETGCVSFSSSVSLSLPSSEVPVSPAYGSDTVELEELAGNAGQAGGPSVATSSSTV